MVVELAVLRQGFAKLNGGGGGVGEGEGCALDVVRLPFLHPLFIGRRGRGPAPLDEIWMGAAAKERGLAPPPKPRGCPL